LTTAKFAGLDGIRGLAALVVMARHTSVFWGFRLPHSHLAVDVFFLLSGFVIAHSYEAKLAQGRLGPVGFMGLRLLRLYPMYALAVLLNGTWRLASPADVVRELLFIPTSGEEIFPLVFVAWSLFYELVVNAMYAFARPALTTRRLFGVAAACFVAVCVTGVHDGTFDFGWTGSLPGMVEGCARATFGIFLGLALFRCRERLWRVLPALPAGAAIAAVVALLCAPSVGREWAFDAMALVLFPALVLIAARTEPPAARVMFLLGAVSYPMYLLHGVAHEVVLAHTDAARHAPLSGLVFGLVLSALCIAAERAYDLPLRRFVKGRMEAARGAARPARGAQAAQGADRLP
jgi:peptidoglycan/LPS O-acetylase OafA/YrhL